MPATVVSLVVELGRQVAWLDEDDQELGDDHLWMGDGILSHIASAFHPYSVDVIGEAMEEKTPSMVCLSLTDEEEPEFPSPEADDKVCARAAHGGGGGARGIFLRRVGRVGDHWASRTLDDRIISARPRTTTVSRVGVLSRFGVQTSASGPPDVPDALQPRSWAPSWTLGAGRC